MKSKRNEIIFKDEIVVLDYLILEYEKELKKTTYSWNNKEIKNTKISRLHRLRIEINELLKQIEKNCHTEYMEEVE